jgi:D-alanine-D-alanine ligase
MINTRVAVLRGGPSSEYEVSLVSGREVITALKSLGYHVQDITVSRSGEWLVDGRTKDPHHALATADVVFIAMHGAYGEDGTVQRICERLHIPFTGSNSFASAVAFNKDLTKRALRDHDIMMPKHVTITDRERGSIDAIIDSIGSMFGYDTVLKPLTSGSSHGIQMASDREALKSALETILAATEAVMVEERIRGTEATVAVLEDFRDYEHYALPPIEIVPPSEYGYFAADVKYDGRTVEICPGRFSYTQKERLTNVATTVHKALGLTQYSRADFMLRGDDVYFLEVNTLPGFTPESLYPKAAGAVGLSFAALVDHLVKTARV